MNVIEGNILDIIEGVILHCVNCQNVMGSGVAKALYTKYPTVKSHYHSFCKGKEPIDLLGNVNKVKVTPNLIIYNCFAQLTYGGKGSGRHLDYGALKLCLLNLLPTSPTYIPYNFGCGLAGGDWQLVSKIFDNLHGDSVIAVKLV